MLVGLLIWFWCLFHLLILFVCLLWLVLMLVMRVKYGADACCTLNLEFPTRETRCGITLLMLVMTVDMILMLVMTIDMDLLRVVMGKSREFNYLLRYIFGFVFGECRES